jgi:hypothetical protein
MKRTTPEMQILLDLLKEAFDRKSWHGPNLRGSLRGVTPEQAAWRPAVKAHNIWELALHAAYWKYVVRRRISGGTRGSFERPGSNFFERPTTLTSTAWRRDIHILEVEQERLLQAVSELPVNRQTPAAFHLIRGAAAHDLYHAGQIRLIRRLCPL